jgi:DNA-directed RNA polymerase subunit RPC12/RpoP
MKLLATCPRCSFQFRAKKKEKGKEIPCPECGQTILVIPRTGLGGVTWGLWAHFAAMPVALLAMGTFVVGLGLVLGGLAGDLLQVHEVGVGFLAVSSVTFLIAGLIDLAPPVLCLFLPDTTSRIFLAASLPVRMAMFPFAIFFLALASRPAALMVAVAFLAVAAWVFWIIFMRRLALHFRRREMADEAMAVLGNAVKTLVPLLILLALAIAVMAIIGRVGSPIGKTMLLGLIASVIGLVLKGVLMGIGGNPLVDEPFMALLYPVGVPFFLKYASLLSAFVQLIRRQ